MVRIVKGGNSCLAESEHFAGRRVGGGQDAIKYSFLSYISAAWTIGYSLCCSGGDIAAQYLHPFLILRAIWT